MLSVEDVRLELLQMMAVLVDELDAEHLPKRGQVISPEMNALGEQVVRVFLGTGQLPSLQDQMMALLPRVWFANAFLENALIHQTPEQIGSVGPSRISAILLLDMWAKRGREAWEAPMKDVPWGG